MHLAKKIKSSGQKKILALDGGGIRGIITIEILYKIESELRIREKNPKLVLSDYFDFVAGTSTGALIGACVSMGMSVSEIRSFYEKNGKEMFDRAGRINEYKNGHKYYDGNLREILQDICGIDTTLNSKKLKTLFLLMMHNMDTDSPWPVSNNPYAKYNNLEKRGKNSNLHLPLWQLLRASTAAPTFFLPENIDIGGKIYSFMDGAITPYNNPSFQAYLMSTLKAYNLNWEKGEKNLLLVSVGTGNPDNKRSEDSILDALGIVKHAKNVPTTLLNSIAYQQDMLCRIFGKCLVGDSLDSEIGDLKGANGSGCTDENLFTYLRYSVNLNRETFNTLNLQHIDPKDISPLDAVHRIDLLKEVGEAVAKNKVYIDDFSGF